MRIHALVALCVVLGCGGGAKHTAAPPPAPDPIPKTTGPSCKAVAEHLATLQDRDPTADEAKLAAPMRSRCETDGWNDEARSCFATAQSDDEVDGCKTKLTDLQRKSFGGGNAATGGAAPAAAAAPAAEAAPAPAPAKKTTRGPVKKGSSKTSDPEEGGE